MKIIITKTIAKQLGYVDLSDQDLIKYNFDNIFDTTWGKACTSSTGKNAIQSMNKSLQEAGIL